MTSSPEKAWRRVETCMTEPETMLGEEFADVVAAAAAAWKSVPVAGRVSETLSK